MKLKLQNVGIIKSAEIRIDGLTVIAGNNDVGKSFIGKALYLAIKSHNGELELRKRKIEDKIIFLLEDLILDFIKSHQYQDKNLNNEVSWRKLISAIAVRISSNDTIEELSTILESELEQFSVFLRSIEDTGNIDTLNLKQEYINKAIREAKESIIKSSVEIFNDRDLDFQSADYWISKIFENQISRKGFEAHETRVDFGTDFNLGVENNKTVEISNVIYGYNQFSGVTYIESPAIYLIAPIIKNQLAFGSRNSNQILDIVEYNIDLTEKLIGKKYEIALPIKNIIEEIKNIIVGKVDFHEFTGDFIYKKNDGLSFSQNNTASGVKWFGLLQTLLNSGNIQKNSIIIIDEPETHLHPKWQIEYAKIIVEMVKNGIYIVLSSHSPYMIEALKRISDKEIKDKTSFYLGEYKELEKGSIFTDVTEGISPIFKTLSSPMNELYLDI